MIKSLASFLSFGLATAGVSTLCAQPLDDDDGPPDFTPEPLEIAIADQFPDAQTDPQTQLIVERANAFLATLDAGQRDAVVFDFTDNAQRPNWSNLPEGLYKRAGIMRGDMTDAQLAALDDLLRPDFKSVENRLIRGHDVRVPYYAVAGHKVWGATAMLLSELEGRLRQVLPAQAATEVERA